MNNPLPTLQELSVKLDRMVFRLDGEFPYSVGLEEDDDSTILRFLWNEVDGTQCNASIGGVKEFVSDSNTYYLTDALNPQVTYQLTFYRPVDPFGIPDGWEVKPSQICDGFTIDGHGTSTLVDKGNNLYNFFKDLLKG